MTLINGPSTGKASITDGAGNYSIANVAAGTYNAVAGMGGYVSSTESVTLSADTRIDFVLSPRDGEPPPWDYVVKPGER